MTRSILALGVAVMLAGCGVDDGAPMGDEVELTLPAHFNALRPPPSHTAVTDEARIYADGVAVPLPLTETQPVQPGDPNIRQTTGCSRLLLSPVVSGTLQQIPQLGVFEPAPMGDAVQASFANAAGPDEYRVGIAEFEPGADVVSATLRFTERRAVASAPTIDDHFALTIYPADLALTLDDWKIAGEDGPTFVTNQAQAPAQQVELDVTKFVQTAGKRIGIRFALDSKQLDGHGTGFDDLKLEVVSCNSAVR